MVDAFIGLVLGFLLGCVTVMFAVHLAFADANNMNAIDDENRKDV